MMPSVNETTACIVISGAAGSLGRVLCSFFLGRNMLVAGLDRVKEDPIQKAASGRWIYLHVDLTDEKACNDVFAEIMREFGQIDLLVNCCGLIRNQPALSFARGRLVGHPLDSWSEVIDANLTTTFVASICAARHMARQNGGGCIINFGSVAGQGNPGQVAYSAAKAGVVGLTKAMARELGPVNVRVNAIAPGFISVQSTEAALSEEKLNEIISVTPVRRLGTTEDITSAVLFLWKTEFVTAAVLPVDGGYIL